MAELSSVERAVVERAGAEHMVDQVLGWAAINSGSRNLAGLGRMADLLVDAFSALPGILRLDNPAVAAGGTLTTTSGYRCAEANVEYQDADGTYRTLAKGRRVYAYMPPPT